MTSTLLCFIYTLIRSNTSDAYPNDQVQAQTAKDETTDFFGHVVYKRKTLDSSIQLGSVPFYLVYISDRELKHQKV